MKRKRWIMWVYLRIDDFDDGSALLQGMGNAFRKFDLWRRDLGYLMKKVRPSRFMIHSTWMDEE